MSFAISAAFQAAIDPVEAARAGRRRGRPHLRYWRKRPLGPSLSVVGRTPTIASIVRDRAGPPLWRLPQVVRACGLGQLKRPSSNRRHIPGDFMATATAAAPTREDFAAMLDEAFGQGNLQEGTVVK